ncbi:MAG: peptide chain release factor N(5)-glutamine methyltransferase [Planctomycetota bacterium]
MSETAAPRTAREMLARGKEFLAKKGVAEARLDAELLVAHALGLDRLHLYLELDRPVEAAEIDRGRALLVRRAAGEPAAYLTGAREFYGRPFRVGPGVLIPRPETELLVDVVRERLAGAAAPRLAELGTGSGCIAVTLALELPGAEVHAVERSERALQFARANAAALGAAVRFHAGDGLAPLRAAAPFAALVANPPYVDPAARETLPREVRDHEPVEALFAPPGDPDHWLRRLLEDGPSLLGPGSLLLIELGHDQAPRARALAAARALPAEFHADLAGIERVLAVTLPRG